MPRQEPAGSVKHLINIKNKLRPTYDARIYLSIEDQIVLVGLLMQEISRRTIIKSNKKNIDREILNLEDIEF